MSEERPPPSWLGHLRECHTQAHTWHCLDSSFLTAMFPSYPPTCSLTIPNAMLLLGLSFLTSQPSSRPPVFLPSEPSKHRQRGQLQLSLLLSVHVLDFLLDAQDLCDLVCDCFVSALPPNASHSGQSREQGQQGLLSLAIFLLLFVFEDRISQQSLHWPKPVSQTIIWTRLPLN